MATSNNQKKQYIKEYIRSLKAIEDCIEPYQEQKRELRSEFRNNGWLSTDEIRAADVGAGTGIFASSLYECGIKNITAVDPNDEMRKVGKEANTKDFKFLKGSAEKTNLPFKSFDLVSMASSFHWTNYLKALKEFDNLLTDNGIFTAIWNPRLTEKSEVESRVQSLLSNKYGVVKRVSSGRSGITENLKEVLLEIHPFSAAS